MKKLLVFGTFCFVLTSVFSQSGYYGRRTFVEFGVMGRNPFLEKLTNYKGTPYYKNENNMLVENPNRIDYGFNLGVTFLSKQAVSFGIVGSFYNSQVRSLTHTYGGYTESNVPWLQRAESFDFKTFMVMPVVTVSHEQLIKPAGLSHEWGLGFMQSSIADRDYLLKVDFYENQEDADNAEAQGLYYNRMARFQAICLMYGLKIRKPLTDRLLLHYGIRYTATIGNAHDKNSANPEIMLYGFEQDVKRALNRNFINFNFGLTFML